MPESRVEELKEALEWLGLISGGASLPAVPSGKQAPIDLLAALLADRLRYQPKERDLVVLSHEIVAKSRKPEAKQETYSSQLIVYGDSKASAMSRTVGLPVAFAALRVLDGHVKVRGVSGPTDRSIWKGVLEDLDSVGLGMVEKITKGRSMESMLAEDYQSIA